MIKLCIERCRECTRFALFFSSSLMHSMIYLFLIIILSHAGIGLFFIHSCFKSMNEPDTLTEQTLEEFLLDVSSVSKHLSMENLCKYRPHSSIPVIYVCPCKTECYHFTGIIAEQMQLESMAPASWYPCRSWQDRQRPYQKFRLTL